MLFLPPFGLPRNGFAWCCTKVTQHIEYFIYRYTLRVYLFRYFYCCLSLSPFGILSSCLQKLFVSSMACAKSMPTSLRPSRVDCRIIRFLLDGSFDSVVDDDDPSAKNVISLCSLRYRSTSSRGDLSSRNTCQHLKGNT